MVVHWADLMVVQSAGLTACQSVVQKAALLDKKMAALMADLKVDPTAERRAA